MSDSENSVNANFNGGRDAFNESEIANPLRRMGGFLLDALLTFVITTLVIHFYWKAQLTWLNRAFFWVFAMWLWDSVWLTASGTTPGKKLLGLSIYSPKNDGIPEPTQVGWRMIGFWIGLFMLGLGLTPILMRTDRRGWADTLSDTLTFGPTPEGEESARRVGGSILFFVQTLSSIALLGALFATLTIHVWNPTDPNENRYTSSQCHNPALLIEHPQEVLFAITVSPAWAECWNKNHFTMNTLRDSELFQLAAVATDFHWVWTHNSSQWESLFKTVNQKLLANAPARNPTAVPPGLPEGTESPLLKDLNRRLESYQSFYKKFLQAQTRPERIEVLTEELKSPNHPIVTGAIAERLWAEQIAEGIFTGKFPENAFKGWREEQVCWLEYFEVARGGSCNHGGFREAIQKIQWLKDNNTSVEEAQYIKEEFDEESVPEDFFLAFDLWISIKKNNRAELEKQWPRFPELSPLHRWAQSYADLVK